MARVTKPDTNQIKDVKETVSATSSGTGVGCTTKLEILPKFNKAECETVISQQNSYIVLGRDRPQAKDSGYGGAGWESSHSIDIITGRRSNDSYSDGDYNPNDRYVDPSFLTDAARIYISERTDIDENFNIVSGDIGKIKNRSGIGLCADAIRIVAQEGGIKLVTRTSTRNSKGVIVQQKYGINLIAGNDDTNLQSMVLGDNLKDLMQSIIKEIKDLNGIVAGMTQALASYEIALLTHVHPPGSPSPMLVEPTIRKIISDIQAFLSTASQTSNLAGADILYLSTIGGKYILSDQNKNN